jgi:hypothetical protein
MSDDNKIVQFIPRDEWERQFAIESNRVDADKPLRKELNRRRVVSAFMDAFELMGGTAALLEWAMRSNENQTQFYKLYSKMLPPPTVELDDASQTKHIIHAVPRNRLDL